MTPAAREALQAAEDAIAFFARAAVLRHFAASATDRAEQLRLEDLAAKAEAIVAKVIQRAWPPRVPRS